MQETPLTAILMIRNTHPDNFGGGEIYQLTLANELKKNNITPGIVSSSTKLLSEAKRQKIKSIRAPYLKQQNWSSWRNLLLPIYLLWQTYLYFWYKNLFRKHRPTAINIQSRDDWIAATLAAKKLNIKVLWTDHADFRGWVFQNINHKFKNPIAKTILKLADIPTKIIMISDFECKFFEKSILPKKLDNIVTIKNGATDQSKKYQGIKPKKQQICFLARIEERKGIKELISAFSNLAKDFPKATLEIYGDGPLREFCQKHQSSQIHFHGFNDKPLKAIAESEIFVLPSHIEGLSLTLIDATMLGKAIIATDIDGNPEVVEHQKTGLLVPVKQPKALEEALRLLLSSPKLCQKFGHAARQKYEREFNFSNTVRNQFLPLLK